MIKGDRDSFQYLSTKLYIVSTFQNSCVAILLDTHRMLFYEKAKQPSLFVSLVKVL